MSIFFNASSNVSKIHDITQVVEKNAIRRTNIFGSKFEKSLSDTLQVAFKGWNEADLLCLFINTPGLEHFKMSNTGNGLKEWLNDTISQCIFKSITSGQTIRQIVSELSPEKVSINPDTVKLLGQSSFQCDLDALTSYVNSESLYSKYNMAKTLKRLYNCNSVTLNGLLCSNIIQHEIFENIPDVDNSLMKFNDSVTNILKISA